MYACYVSQPHHQRFVMQAPAKGSLHASISVPTHCRTGRTLPKGLIPACLLSPPCPFCRTGRTLPRPYLLAFSPLSFSSFSFRLFPRQKKYRPFFAVRTIAHRGGRETTPENTMRAFEVRTSPPLSLSLPPDIYYVAASLGAHPTTVAVQTSDHPPGMLHGLTAALVS